MTNLKETVAWYARATLAEKTAFLNSLAAASDEPRRRQDTTPDVEPIVLSQALAAARRAGVEVDQKTGRVNVIDLNASLAKSTMTPLQKIETKTLLAAAHMIS